MKCLVVLVICLCIVPKTLSISNNTELVATDCEEDESCEDDSCVQPSACVQKCQQSRCCQVNYRGGCCNQCKQRCERVRCRDTCTNTRRCPKTETTTVTPKNTTESEKKSKTETVKLDHAFDVNSTNSNKADIKTNVLMTNKIKNENAVNIPIEVNEKNVNDFVIDLPQQQSSSRRIIIKEKNIQKSTEEHDDDDDDDDDDCCNKQNSQCCRNQQNNCCNEYNTDLGRYNPCQYGGYNCPSYHPCRWVYYAGKYIRICPNEQSTEADTARIKPTSANYPEDKEKMTLKKDKGCNACLYCDGGYNPAVCISKKTCTDICRDYLLNPKTASPVKCTISPDGKYTCERFY